MEGVITPTLASGVLTLRIQTSPPFCGSCQIFSARSLLSIVAQPPNMDLLPPTLLRTTRLNSDLLLWHHTLPNQSSQPIQAMDCPRCLTIRASTSNPSTQEIRALQHYPHRVHRQCHLCLPSHSNGTRVARLPLRISILSTSNTPSTPSNPTMGLITQHVALFLSSLLLSIDLVLLVQTLWIWTQPSLLTKLLRPSRLTLNE